MPPAMTTDPLKPVEHTPKPTAGKETGSSFLRVLSLLAAIACAMLVILYPRAIAHDAAGVPHGLLVGMLVGMSILWVYGFGFVPRHRVVRLFFSPLLGWAFLLGFGTAVFLH